MKVVVLFVTMKLFIGGIHILEQVRNFHCIFNNLPWSMISHA